MVDINWLEKATWTTPDITPGTGAGLLSPTQAQNFIRIAIEVSILLREARNEFSASPSFEVPRISMANRILRPGVEGARLADSDRVTPTTGLVTLVTKLFKGEVPVEEIAIKSDTARTGGEVALFDQFDGIIKGLQSGLPTAQKLDATAVTTYDDLFANMVEALPVRYRRNYNNLRLYVPVRMKDGYQRSLAARGTGLGDQALINNLATQLAFRGIPVVDVPMLSGTDTINSGSVNYANFAFLYDPQNLIVGWHRRVRVERWRDPREGVTSFLPSLRYDVKFAVPDFGVLAYNVGSI
jgi:hypothetical protein